MINRLKLMRKIRGLTQKQIAEHMNISQNTYSYWENGKVNISNGDMQKLAALFKISADFLSGRQYNLRSYPHTWREDLYVDYVHASAEEKIYMEYLHGNIAYIDSDESTDAVEAFTPVSEQEKMLLSMFRHTTEDGRMRMIQSVLNIYDQMEEKKNPQAIGKNA